MSTFFTLLLLISVGLLLWGLISPESLSKFSRKPMTRQEAGVWFGIATFILFTLTGVTAPKASLTVTPANSAKTTSTLKDVEKKKLPVITTQTVTETESIPYSSMTVESGSLAKGTSKVTTAGVNGVKTRTYELTLSDGVQTDKKLVKEEVTTQPINQVTTIGTYVAPVKSQSTSTSSSCDPNYSGTCVPNVYPSDVDCGGGSGNGPYYVYGTVHVIGSDIYGLDRDGDGYGCE